tara:strand:+ start:161 stop:676 length:516 start_codon:yes stop_codon:yes gene_type:complete
MAIVQISQIKNRRGVESDLPQLASAELGWSVDTQKLYIGNGTLAEGAPEIGNTRILTTQDLPFANGVVISGNLTDNTTSLLTNSTFDSTIPGIIMNYVLTRASNVRVGTFCVTSNVTANVVHYSDDYTETDITGVYFQANIVSNTYTTISANLTSTGSGATIKFSFDSVTF